jgi:hypothetical protein
MRSRRDLDRGLATTPGSVLGGTVPTAARRIERQLQTAAAVANLGEPARRVTQTPHHLRGRQQRPACRHADRASTGSSRSLWSSAEGTVLA